MKEVLFFLWMFSISYSLLSLFRKGIKVFFIAGGMHGAGRKLQFIWDCEVALIP